MYLISISKPNIFHSKWFISTLLLLLSACVDMSSNMHMVYSNACMRHRCDRQVNKHFVWLNKILNYIHRTFTHCNLSEQFCKIVSCFLKDTIDITVPRYPTNIYAVCSANQKASRRFFCRVHSGQSIYGTGSWIWRIVLSFEGIKYSRFLTCQQLLTQPNLLKDLVE